MVTYIAVAFMFFAIGVTLTEWWTERTNISLPDQLDLAKHKGECRKKRDIAFFTKMVIRELKKDLSKGYNTSSYYGTLWWKIKNKDVAKEVSKSVSQLTGLDFTHAYYSDRSYSIDCSNIIGKKES